MQAKMKLQDLLREVIRQQEVKRDFTASTQDNVRLDIDRSAFDVEVEAGHDPLRLILLKEGAGALERFTLSENAHRQIAGRLSIPWKYYGRLLADHPDLIQAQVNALFEREPESRLLRVLDGQVRAFLSDRYLRLDNDAVLEEVAPLLMESTERGDLRVMSSNVGPDKMHVKAIFTDDSLAHEVARAHGEPRIIRPGFRLSNSETGNGSLNVEGFFYDAYCTNGCVWGIQDTFQFRRNHLGGRLIEGEGFEVISRETRELENGAILSAVRDCMAAVSQPENVARLADQLRRAAESDKVQHPTGAIDLAVKELDLRESDRTAILETFLRDGDFSQYGLAAAVTERANNAEQVDYSRACELENIGAQILTLGMRGWGRYVEAEPVAQAA